jgi:hypothetical protein
MTCLRRQLSDLVELISDEVHYAPRMELIAHKLRFGTALADSGLPIATMALVLLKQAERELMATEPGKRLTVALNVLRGRPTIYRATIEGRVQIDDETLAVDNIVKPAATLHISEGEAVHVRFPDVLDETGTARYFS